MDRQHLLVPGLGNLRRQLLFRLIVHSGEYIVQRRAPDFRIVLSTSCKQLLCLKHSKEIGYPAPVSNSMSPSVGCSMSTEITTSFLLELGGFGLDAVLVPPPLRKNPSSASRFPQCSNCKPEIVSTDTRPGDGSIQLRTHPHFGALFRC